MIILRSELREEANTDQDPSPIDLSFLPPLVVKEKIKKLNPPFFMIQTSKIGSE